MMFSRIATSTAKRTSKSRRGLASAWSGDLSFSSPESDFLWHAVPRSGHSSAHAHHEWTRSLSFASPESDFKSSFEVHHLTAPPAEWSAQISFASPEADYTCNPTAPDAEWSNHYSFTSPESDFKAHILTLSQQQAQVYDDLVHRNEQPRESDASPVIVWSGDLSFSSPESDFLAETNPRFDHVGEHHDWTQSLTFASPESDFQSSFDEHHMSAPVSEWSEGLSFASPEADFTCNPTAPDIEWSNHYSFSSPESDFAILALPEQQGQEYLNDFLSRHPLYHQSILHPESALGEIPVHHLMSSLPVEPLPRSLADAMSDTRAVVITSAEKPFEIVDVNDAWVGLCGFERAETLQGSLKMLQGQATNISALDSLMASLQQGQEAQTLVTNYKKSGAAFLNHVQAGVIRDAQTQEVTHFVGVLQEILLQDQRMSAY